MLMVLGVIMSKKKDGKDKVDQSIEYKVNLERRLYLAKETPEPIFDLSCCNLINIPNDVFSLCRVFGKTALYLQENQLKSLASGGALENLRNIKILNISANKFEKLPSDLYVMESLEILDVSQNCLQALPDSIGDLKKLKKLNASDNYLLQLPESLGYCSSLNALNVKNNKFLKQLPVTLGRLRYLTELEIDPIIVFPPKKICSQGVKAVLSFLTGEDENLPTTSWSFARSPKNVRSLGQFADSSQKEKQMEILNIERQIWDDREREVRLQQQVKEKKERLIEEVKNQQKILDAEIAKVQGEKESGRTWLIQHCLNEEERSIDSVNRILSANRKLRIKTADFMEEDKKQEEELLFQKLEVSTLGKKQILISMDEQMKEEVLRANKIIEQKRLFVVKSLASELLSQDNALNILINKSDQVHSYGVEIIRKNEEFQKSAVASLLEKSDATSWKLSKQIAIIEAELAELTKLELMKKKVQSDSRVAELTKNRIFLAQELMELFKQQEERRKRLVEVIRKMETMKNSDIYWMEQYEKLLHSKSYQMVGFLEAVHPTLAHELFLNGVFQFLPLLKNVALSIEELQKLNGDKLAEMGIKNEKDRTAILKAVKTFLEPPKEKPSAPKWEQPSLPIPEQPLSVKLKSSSYKLNNVSSPKCAITPSAPEMCEIKDVFKSCSYSVPEECVICIERKPDVIFIPCGHICCCEKCFQSVSTCPLCRQQINVIYELVSQN